MDDTSFLGSYTVGTDAGMCCLWQPEHFAHVTSYDVWEDALGNDPAIERSIEAGAFVPLYLHSDGVYQVTLRTGARTPREKRYTTASSEPYLLVSKGAVALSGIEAVGADLDAAETIALAPGRYAVEVHLIDWQAEPGSTDADGNAVDGALPDFVVEISPEPDPAPPYRRTVETFDLPEE
ncbi:MAG TPA: hypothetical protein VIL71_23595 [Spirillospora sp.]|jgi:hypothetical protein|uniref:Uncharacterized protein n=1 Tax=Thermopolyspora flexuosa TaxID=103836 RepID=A0A543IUF7_9ACTN|nr:hypothetical protein [Thermopolyspora flexuosa]PZN41517.1 MAG: hypothetical protein DIU60_16855 [Actinomycetota bacterium]TQM74210.1 hypothetical protein FHX40_0875 [Thermopolyspora flexuosa]GGM89391.1 hypothetical protein GCM10010106_41000 [Thermopolyspora flexuosa]